MPIYFLLNATYILNRSDSRFTARNAAADPPLLSTPAELSGLPFNLIYHDSYLSSEEKNTVVSHRNAEVLVSDRLDLNAVWRIACRSQAEYQTLLHLLPQGGYTRWADRITVWPALFFREWTYVHNVVLGPEWAECRFNPGRRTPGPFKARAEILTTSRSVQWSEEEYWAREPLRLNWGDLEPDYALHLYFDDSLAFADRFQEEELPF